MKFFYFPFKIPSVLIFIGLVLTLGAGHLHAQSAGHSTITSQELKIDSLERLVQNYSDGFIHSNSNFIRNSIGQQLLMMNGNYSCKPVDWQAHQYLHETEIDDWITMMLNNAGPFKNSLIVKNVDIRGNSALVVTEETGENKFRKWKNEEVTYMLGKASGKWGIVGFFIKDIKNPD